MLRNRLILVAAILAAGVFASFYGGNIPYALFYLTLLIPLVSLLYTLYVYLRVKVYQMIDSVVLVKGESSTYTFRVANEDFLSYQNLKINFYTGMSSVEGAEQQMSYCLLPGESISMETRLACHYRGIYNVGARSIEITDLFNLFQLSYPIRSRNSVTVLPRRVRLSSLNILPQDEDSKNVLFHTRAKAEELDIDMRKYVPGDSRRLVHWKATARRGELMSRQYTETMKLGVLLCMDLTPTGLRDWLERAEREDKIIESSIAIADYCLAHRIPCDVWFAAENDVQKAPARTAQEMDAFYNLCGRLAFTAKEGAGKVISRSLEQQVGAYRYLVITHTLDGDLYSASVKAAARGNEVAVVLMCDALTEEQQRIRTYMNEASIRVVQIQHDRDFADAFEQTGTGGAV